jgi:hypothetical protein
MKKMKRFTLLNSFYVHIKEVSIAENILNKIILSLGRYSNSYTVMFIF